MKKIRNAAIAASGSGLLLAAWSVAAGAPRYH